MITSPICLKLGRSLIRWPWNRRFRTAVFIDALPVGTATHTCPKCKVELVFLLGGPLGMLGTPGSRTSLGVFWCRNLDCQRSLDAFGFPFIQSLSEETIRNCTPSNGIVVLGIARDVDEKQPVKGSKIGGLPYGCDAEVPEYDEFLASISASHLEKPVFPGHADIGLFVHEGEVGYSMML